MAINTNMSFESVEQKVENEGYRVYQVNDGAEGLYVELRGDGTNVSETGVKQLEYYMDTKEDFQKVKEKYM